MPATDHTTTPDTASTSQNGATGLSCRVCDGLAGALVAHCPSCHTSWKPTSIGPCPLGCGPLQLIHPNT